MRIIVTGCAGFIGSHFTEMFLRANRLNRVTGIDSFISPAATIRNLEPVLYGATSGRFELVRRDIADPSLFLEKEIFRGVEAIVNFAAETHVDDSIADGLPFVRSNVLGVANLLEICCLREVPRFVQVSTDEVYGESKTADEDCSLQPSNPYAASKAGAEHLVRSYGRTHGLDVRITRGSNTYGPRQHPSKLLPKAITKFLNCQTVPVYGDGRQVRQWMHVWDHARGIFDVLRYQGPHTTFNLGGIDLFENLTLLRETAPLCGIEHADSYIRMVRDRPGHDRYYGIYCGRAARELLWTPAIAMATPEGLQATVEWYRDHPDWWG